MFAVYKLCPRTLILHHPYGTHTTIVRQRRNRKKNSLAMLMRFFLRLLGCVVLCVCARFLLISVHSFVKYFIYDEQIRFSMWDANVHCLVRHGMSSRESQSWYGCMRANGCECVWSVWSVQHTKIGFWCAVTRRTKRTITRCVAMHTKTAVFSYFRRQFVAFFFLLLPSRRYMCIHFLSRSLLRPMYYIMLHAANRMCIFLF